MPGVTLHVDFVHMPVLNSCIVHACAEVISNTIFLCLYFIPVSIFVYLCLTVLAIKFFFWVVKLCIKDSSMAICVFL